MKKKYTSMLRLVVLSAVTLLAGCERPPIEVVQHGFRGTGMAEIYNPRTVATQAKLNEVPAAIAPATPGGPPAAQVYQNVQVLNDLTVGEFSRLMVAMTSWVAPEQGCTYCHNAQNFASDENYTKVVARKMLQMTRKINTDYKSHVAATGVTCYTCHRGNNIPTNVWFKAPHEDRTDAMIGDKAGQNTVSLVANKSSLPVDPFTPLLLGTEDIRVNGTTALPTGNRHSIKQAEWTYSLMTHMSTSLGVNCTYCHNSRSFANWAESPPQRVTAWYGIRMVRDLNTQYMEPIEKVFPAHRLGPSGDVAKANCSTCHQGAFKPLYGVSMLKDHPELAGQKPALASPAAGEVAAPPVSADSATVFFAVGSSVLTDDAAKKLDAVLLGLSSNTSAKAVISGFHSAAGDLKQNQELAKQRALAVRDVLQARGIPAERVLLEKPQSAEANLSGEDPQARRVDVAIR
ncbi:MAG: photosynthetic reaction center cytochrome PufC [Rhizobacter sp.]